MLDIQSQMRQNDSMERDGFPITLWPGVPVPDPPIESIDIEVTFDDAGLIPGWRDAHSTTLPPLPEEFVLRQLQELDLCSGSVDQSKVANFVNRWGLPYQWVGEPVTGRFAEVVERLSTVQALARTWMAWMRDDHLLPVWADVPHLPFKVTSETDVWPYFVWAINSGLQLYPMRAELPESEDPDYTHGKPRIDIYSACCIQLASIISENLPAHECANEACGRSFIRQQGQAKKGQFRTVGVLYCSLKCQRAQAARQFRRKQREEGEQS